MQIFDGNYDEIRDWIIHGQVDCGFLSSIVADNLKFYPLCEDPLCAVMQKNHPLAEKKSVRLEELLEYPFIIETPGCDNDILHLLSLIHILKELIRTEENGAISFGDYELAQKSKLSDYQHQGDMYKVKTFKEITKLERNGMFVYESVPGTAVFNLTQSEAQMDFHVEGPEDAQITV